MSEAAPFICPQAGVCGGCAYQGVPYEAQLSAKNAEVLAHLEENGIKPDAYLPVRRTSAPVGYRGKMEYSFGDEIKDGPMTLGLHKQGSYMSVINTPACVIVPESFNIIRDAVLGFALAKGYGFWHKKTHTGFLRSLVLRRGARTGELLVALETSSEGILDEGAFAELILGLSLGAAKAADAGGTAADHVVGVLHSLNDRRSDAVTPDILRVLWGRDHYFEEMLGLRFRVGAFSFFQTNTEAACAMFVEAIAMLGDGAGASGQDGKGAGQGAARTLYDVYCGTGTISLALAGAFGHVVGVELAEDSVRSARENAALNGIENCDFICGDAFKVLSDLEKPDMLACDPPRMGLHPKALARVIGYGLPRLLYISCNPKTFARDAAAAQRAGYRVSRLAGYDNFPFTKHVELVALIEKT
ncbi:MAG: 23S rRNA (uracil(1939)-C(5))-methyltransferase RlmD [Clostridiales Family XIII bacterium]|nr:23S rRNA (uracil(1939)-C(5))-methyltransferase RlmD [Clostridiales Family XIII bacterium]